MSDPFPTQPDLPVDSIPTDLPAAPAPDASTPAAGVAFNAPPPHLISDTMANINAALATLPPDAHGAIISVADQSGVNAAVVAKIADQWSVVAFVGKTWTGPIQYGAEARWTW